jgi:hydroxymethylglutaryl-CoA lyase
VRGYLSTIHTCPYDGRTPIDSVLDACRRLFDLGCFEISLGDTLGTCTPFEARHLLGELAREFGPARLALHFHNTYGQALANLYVGLELGFRRIDSSIAGLGGCPYASGASGNVATEDVVYMLTRSGLDCGIDLGRLLDASRFISQVLQRPPQSSLGRIQHRNSTP